MSDSERDSAVVKLKKEIAMLDKRKQVLRCKIDQLEARDSEIEALKMRAEGKLRWAVDDVLDSLFKEAQLSPSSIYIKLEPLHEIGVKPRYILGKVELEFN